MLIFSLFLDLKIPNENKPKVQTFLSLWNSYNIRDTYVANWTRLYKAFYSTQRMLFQRELKHDFKKKYCSINWCFLLKTSIMLQIINGMYLLNILQNFSSSPLKAAILTTTTTKAIKTSQNKLSEYKTKKLSELKSVILDLYLF